MKFEHATDLGNGDLIIVTEFEDNEMESVYADYKVVGMYRPMKMRAKFFSEDGTAYFFTVIADADTIMRIEHARRD